ncbi:MAG: leucine-rich repeat domain-containing protein [Bacteroidota bacterium]
MKNVLTSILQGVSPKLVSELWLDFEDTQQYSKDPFDVISGLEPFEKLEKLSLAGHSIKELRQLPFMESLIYLDVSHNDITHLSGIEGLSNLTYLDLSYNELTEIRPLEKAIFLKHLNLGHNHLTQLEGLESLVDLQWLNLSGQHHRQIRKLDALDPFQALTTLFVAYLKLESLEFLKNKAELRVLSCSPLPQTDLSPLAGLKNLEELTIGARYLAEDLHLPPLTKLEILRIQQGRLTHGAHLKGLEFAKQLKSLHLISLDLESLPDLSQCVELETVIIKSNQITELGPLMDLPKLRHLDLRQNPVNPEAIEDLYKEKPGLEVIY